MSLPSTVSRPALGRSRAPSRVSRLLLPLPEGPATTVSAPGSSSSPMPRSAWVSPVAERKTFTRSSQDAVGVSATGTEHLRC